MRLHGVGDGVDAMYDGIKGEEKQPMAEEKPKRVMSEEQKAKIRATMLARYGAKKRKGKGQAKARAKKAPKVYAAPTATNLRGDVAKLIVKYGFDAVYETAKVIERQVVEGGN